MVTGSIPVSPTTKQPLTGISAAVELAAEARQFLAGR